MTLTALVTKPISQLQLAPGSLLTVPDVSWSEFEAILGEWGHRRAARVAYFHNVLEIMVPLPEHEKPKELIRSEEHTSELQSQSTISYAVFCLKKKKKTQ